MRTIWRVPFDVSIGGDKEIVVELPTANELLHVERQNDILLSLWFEVNDSDLITTRKFVRVLTGDQLQNHWQYVGTGIFDNGNFVTHVYEAMR